MLLRDAGTTDEVCVGVLVEVELDGWKTGALALMNGELGWVAGAAVRGIVQPFIVLPPMKGGLAWIAGTVVRGTVQPPVAGWNTVVFAVEEGVGGMFQAPVDGEKGEVLGAVNGAGGVKYEVLGVWNALVLPLARAGVFDIPLD